MRPSVQVSSRAGSADRPGRAAFLRLTAAFTTVVAWSSSFVGIRVAGQDLSAGALSLVRLAVGSLVLGQLVLLRRESLPNRHDLPAIAACGLLWFGVYNLALNEAERRIDAGTAAMLVSLGPLLIAVLAGLLLKEGFPRALFVGCGVAFSGTVIIALAAFRHAESVGWGTALCLAAALAYAISVIVQKPVLARVSALQVTWLACTVGALSCLPFAPILVDELEKSRPQSLAWAVYLGVGPTAIAFTTWAYALARTSAGRLGTITFLVPPAATFLGWVILGETPPAMAIVGGALCLVGVLLAQRSPPPHPPRRTQPAE